MIGVWLTQGRLEDYRSEFVYGVRESIVNCKLSQEPTEIEDQKITYVNAPTEKFWTEGFIVRPFEKVLMDLGLKPPKMFESTLRKVLTCGKRFVFFDHNLIFFRIEIWRLKSFDFQR